MEKNILEKLLEIAKIDPNFTIDYEAEEIRYVEEGETKVLSLKNTGGPDGLNKSNQLRFFFSQRGIDDTTYTNNDDTLIQDLEIEIKKRSLEAELIKILNIALIRLYQNLSPALRPFSDIFGLADSYRQEIQKNPSSRLQLKREERVIERLEELFKKNIILLPIDFNRLFSKAKQVAESMFRSPQTIRSFEYKTIEMFQTTLKLLILSQEGNTEQALKQALEELSAKFKEVVEFRRSLDQPSETVNDAQSQERGAKVIVK